MKKSNPLKLSVVVPVYNVKYSLENCLESLKMQDYPISEIIIVDNHSLDSSVEIAEKFKEKNKNLNIRIVKRKKTYGVSDSYNLGAKLAKENYIVTIHSDGVIATKHELRKLVNPILLDSSIVATYPTGLHPRSLWLTYNFWQKCLFARDIDQKSIAINGLFDCYRKEAFLRIGGYDQDRFSNTFGSEDADMSIRLGREGKLVATTAEIIHQHSFEGGYTYKNWISRRRFLAISYGHLMRIHALSMKKDVVIYFIKPMLVLSSLLGFINLLFLIPLLLFPFFYMSRMFTDSATLKDPRILTLPFLLLFLVYYESFLIIYVMLFNKVPKWPSVI